MPRVFQEPWIHDSTVGDSNRDAPSRQACSLGEGSQRVPVRVEMIGERAWLVNQSALATFAKVRSPLVVHKIGHYGRGAELRGTSASMDT